MPTLQPSSDVVYRELEGEVVLVHLPSNRIYALNETGAALWRLLEQGCNRQQIHETLTQEFAVGASLLEREIEDMLERLESAGLISTSAE